MKNELENPEYPFPPPTIHSASTESVAAKQNFNNIFLSALCINRNSESSNDK